ncbi:30S ribosomal protein S13 [Candidatus Woesearchaeota archaeon]|nr:30S ribosomal protein S13 [Candidatus Woesearchaeota archaeon]
MEKESFKHIVRIANTDVDGKKQIVIALQKIKGVGHIFSNMACVLSGVQKQKKAGNLSEKEAQKLNEIITNPKKHGASTWMLNRRKDIESGEDKHILTSDLQFQLTTDKKRLQKIKSYRGLRGAAGLPVRGQRTKSNFRRNKGKAMGVKRKK